MQRALFCNVYSLGAADHGKERGLVVGGGLQGALWVLPFGWGWRGTGGLGVVPKLSITLWG